MPGRRPQAMRQRLALLEVEAGNRQQARADAEAALKMARNRDVLGRAALALAMAGDVVTAEQLAAELDRGFPVDTLVQRYRLPAIRAAVALQRKDAKRAIEQLRETEAIELGDGGMLLPVYLRGEAYLMLRDGNRAAGRISEVHRSSRSREKLSLGIARAFATR